MNEHCSGNEGMKGQAKISTHTSSAFTIRMFTRTSIGTGLEVEKRTDSGIIFIWKLSGDPESSYNSLESILV